MVTAHALLPLLRALRSFSKLCQARGVFLGELADALTRLKARIKRMYSSPEAYNMLGFPELRILVGTPSGGSAVHTGPPLP